MSEHMIIVSSDIIKIATELFLGTWTQDIEREEAQSMAEPWTGNLGLVQSD